ncbi:ubiquitin-like protein Pup [Bifidobacterium sp. DSM 109960]|uniref:Prokaryotic ubiquitin-like protein Pup n=1 Tax=Bifidobacterium erythrocebi TaxID=2675325 RepID=A0A7Y0HU33_9BIFI|nr:ubiquitin-like protein Pup [Bifidobacterium sp. DSM 109960]NMM95746.1 ubiquitin-like protein Pup [Bifidobacterium sp. DSM 109960]
MPQQFQQKQQENQQPAEEEQVAKAAAGQQQDDFDALDSVLDDIASTLETSAEDYVSSFVQKGGE